MMNQRLGWTALVGVAGAAVFLALSGQREVLAMAPAQQELEEVSEQEAPQRADERFDAEQSLSEVISLGEPEEEAIDAPADVEPLVVVRETHQSQSEDEGVIAAAQAPILVSASSKLSFQALLTDGAGDPLTVATVDLEFRIWRGAALVEGPIAMNRVPVTNGVVDTLVPVSGDSFNGGSRQLGVTLVSPASGELLPRIQLGAVPYAFRVDRVASQELDDEIELGDATVDGNLKVWDNSSNAVSIELDGASAAISTYGSDGLEQARLHGSTWGELVLHDRNGNDVGAVLGAPAIFFGFPNPTWSDLGGRLTLNDGAGSLRALMSAPSTGGSLQLYDSAAGASLQLTGAGGVANAEGSFNVVDALGGANRARIYKTGSGGRFITYDETDLKTAWLGSSGAAGGFLEIYQKDGGLGMIVDGDATGNDGGGRVTVYNAAALATVYLEGAEGSQNSGQIRLRNSSGSTTITLDAENGNGGNGRVITHELQITGGADLSEQFDISAAGGEAKPGMVVSIDPTRPGQLKVSGKAYDRTVAGVVSGAGGVKTGMLMGQDGSEANGATPVALSGRVYTWCDASTDPIQPGDLLTSSDTAGHAMKVNDFSRSQGAIIGKAMTSLESGRGLVLVLVSLQ